MIPGPRSIPKADQNSPGLDLDKLTGDKVMTMIDHQIDDFDEV